MINVAFKHDVYEGRTYALELPSKDVLYAAKMAYAAGGAYKLEVKLGVARLHPDDRYVKVTGREIASQKLVPAFLDLKKLIVNDKEDHFEFETEKLTFFMSCSRNSGKIRLLNVLSKSDKFYDY